MNEEQRVDPRSDRKFLLGIGIFIGMLVITLIQDLAQMSWIVSAAKLAGVLFLLMIYRALEREMPRGVDLIATKAADMQEDKRIALRNFLKEED